MRRFADVEISKIRRFLGSVARCPKFIGTEKCRDSEASVLERATRVVMPPAERGGALPFANPMHMFPRIGFSKRLPQLPHTPWVGWLV